MRTQKVWPTHERRSAFDNAIQRGVEDMLLIRFEQTVVPGLSPSVHYLNAAEYDSTSLAAFLPMNAASMNQN